MSGKLAGRADLRLGGSAMKLSRRGSQWMLLGGLLMLSGLGVGGCAESLGGSTAANATPVVRVQSRPTALDPLMARAKEAPADKVMKLELEFAVRNQAQLDQLMAEIEDPHSKRYHQWVTPEEMHTRFGETQAEFDAVTQWLQSEGLKVTDKSFGTNEDFIRFTGTVAQVDKAFQVHIMEPQFELYVPKEAPAIPARFKGVIARINGLDNVGFMSSESN
jgi:Pro-kumamolisin, activation domain